MESLDQHKKDFLAGLVDKSYEPDFSWAYDLILDLARQTHTEGVEFLDHFEQLLSVYLTKLLNGKLNATNHS